jgi:hypothetical protein
MRIAPLSRENFLFARGCELNLPLARRVRSVLRRVRVECAG